MSVYTSIIKSYNRDEVELASYSSVALAYLGDSVYENIIRSIIISEGNQKVEKLHDRVTALSKASSQSKMIDLIMDSLSDEEISIYKRGRNASKHSQAKHQKIADYKKSTGFEALVGWLYLKGEDNRLINLLNIGIKELLD